MFLLAFQEILTTARRSFNLLDDLNIEPVINIRKNASTIKTKPCPLRAEEVVLIKKLGYDVWKQLKDTGRRWIAEKFKAQEVEGGIKVMLYNKFVSL
jgi:hypothetical protein